LFERPHHRRIATLLDALDGELLAAHRWLFGGGTAAALQHGEYRESVDVDFLVSDVDGYRGLRQLAAEGNAMSAFARRDLNQLRELRVDQYGIRTLIEIDGQAIKFEIIHEGRIVLEASGPEDRLRGVATLSALDLVATKLLANADRWADRVVYNRDIIDLAMIAPTADLMRQAIAKASVPYGDSVRASINRAIDYLQDNPHRLDECQEALRMQGTPKAVLWQRIKRLRFD